MFFSDVIFLWLLCLLLCCSSCSFLSSPVYGFSGRPPAGRAVVNGASEAVSALTGFHPDAKPRVCSDRNGRATLVARGLRSRHPGKRPPGCKGQRRSRTRSPSLRRVPAHCLPGATTRMSPCRRGLIQPQPAALTARVNEQPTKFFTQNPVKNFASAQDRCVRPWQ